MTLNLASNCAWIEKKGDLLSCRCLQHRQIIDRYSQEAHSGGHSQSPHFKDKGLEVQFRECEPEGETPGTKERAAKGGAKIEGR